VLTVITIALMFINNRKIVKEDREAKK